MDREMININANLVKEAKFSEYEKDGESIKVSNFALVKKYGNGKNIQIAQYMEKIEREKQLLLE